MEERCKLVQELELCMVCLRRGHATEECRRPWTCRVCGERHHTTIHQYDPEPDDETSSNSMEPDDETNSNNTEPEDETGSNNTEPEDDTGSNNTEPDDETGSNKTESDHETCSNDPGLDGGSNSDQSS